MIEPGTTFPVLLVPDEIDQPALDAAGIDAYVAVDPDGIRRLQFHTTATDADFQLALNLLRPDPVAQAVVDQSRVDLTDAWLDLKARFEALPSAPLGTELDPYEQTRVRLQGLVDAARQAMDDAGGAL